MPRFKKSFQIETIQELIAETWEGYNHVFFNGYLITRGSVLKMTLQQILDGIKQKRFNRAIETELQI